MKRVIVVVEGQTEEEFIKKIVSPHLAEFNISMVPIVVRTSQNVKGGITSYEKFKNDVVRYLKQDMSVHVTSMIDFFRIPTSFPYYDDLGNFNNVYKKVSHLEKGMERNIGDRRFIPYIQLHEFEALLFSDVVGFKGVAVFSARSDSDIINEVQEIISKYSSPELINSRPEFAPSKRIQKMIPEYNKVLFGSIIAEEIGIIKILEKCHRFSKWIEQIKALS